MTILLRFFFANTSWGAIECTSPCEVSRWRVGGDELVNQQQMTSYSNWRNTIKNHSFFFLPPVFFIAMCVFFSLRFFIQRPIQKPNNWNGVLQVGCLSTPKSLGIRGWTCIAIASTPPIACGSCPTSQRGLLDHKGSLFWIAMVQWFCVGVICLEPCAKPSYGKEFSHYFMFKPFSISRGFLIACFVGIFRFASRKFCFDAFRERIELCYL